VTTLAQQLTAPGSFARFCNFMNPELQQFHYEWANGVAIHDEFLGLGPRGHWKSTVMCQYQALWRLACNPNARICLISNSSQEAKKNLRYIKGQMENNRELVKLFPHLAPGHTVSMREQRRTGKMWRDDQITISGRLAAGESSIIAVGLYGAITGQHYEHHLFDDCVDFENSRTEYQRDKLEEWIAQTVEGTLEPGGTMTWIGTRYHWQDQYGKLLEGTLADQHVVHSAINYDEDGKEVALFPERFDLDELHKRKRRMGTTKFNCQYQNDTAAMQGSKFKPDYFKYWKELPPDECQIYYIGVDTSMGKTITSDFTAWCVGIIDSRDLNYYILEAGHERLNLEGRRALIRRLNEKYPQTIRIGIEAVAFAADFVEDMQAEIPKCKPIDQQYSKEIRAERLEPVFEQGMVWFGPNGAHDALEQELLMFPEGKYDDMFDAMEIFIRIAAEGSAGEGILEIGDPAGMEAWSKRDGWDNISI